MELSIKQIVKEILHLNDKIRDRETPPDKVKEAKERRNELTDLLNKKSYH